MLTDSKIQVDQEIWGTGIRFAKEERKGRGFGNG
jgi:hypothetical protein